jgi:hypothetical protein
VLLHGHPVASDGATLDEALTDSLRALRDYAAAWEERLHAAPDHRHAAALVQLVALDGRVLRTRITRPPDRTTYGPRLWAHVLRDQLKVTGDEFWAYVDDGLLPDRRPDRPSPARESTIPVEVAELLVGRVGLRREDLVSMSRTDAIARLTAYWTTGR